LANFGEKAYAQFPALQYGDFRTLWFGMFFASATMMFQFYAQGWFVTGLTDSVALLGVLGVARGTGMLLFSMWGGALADRVERRTLLIVTQSVALTLFGVLSVLILLDAIVLWQAFVFIFVVAAVESIDAPARQALIPELLPREHIPNGVALFMAAQISSFAYLPPLAGVAIAGIGPGGAFAISLLGHVVVIGALLRMKIRSKPGGGRESILRSVGQGIRYATGRPPVVWVILLGFFIGVLGFPIITTLAPYWMRHELGLGPVGWTLLGWVWGLGTVASTVFLSASKFSAHQGKIIVWSGTAFALTLIVFGLTRSIPIAAVAWCLNGTFFTANLITSASLLQTIVENQFMGRVMSLRALSSAINQISAAPLGAVADGVGMGNMVPAAAILLTLLIAGPALLVPAVRALDEAQKPDMAEVAPAG
jgi:MFS family permease